ncbi:MAG: C1 family peptidase [bacterium]|nr:C1 family peptidase [bacterium]
MNKIINIAALSLSSSLACASPLTLSGEVEVQLAPKTINGVVYPLIFKLPTYQLSVQAQHFLRQQLADYPKNKVYSSSYANELPRKINLGMELTPVLNQGRHGSCVTFAVTAAIDAVLGAGDYISQLCSLELGGYLAIHDKMGASGWDGTYGAWVIQQINEYGIISQNYQKMHGCAGVYEYPVAEETNQGQLMSENDFLAHSIPIANLIEWNTLLQDEEAFSSKTNTDQLIPQIKEELAKGNRLAMAMLLDVDQGHAGALGSYHAANDTWMLTQEIITDAMSGSISAGHELVIIGYDDDAEVKNEAGITNKGLFTLRNSWSKLAGDQGNYYVSYDYLKFLVTEASSLHLKAKTE